MSSEPGLCRFCSSLTKHRYLDKIYFINGHNKVYSEILEECFGIKLCNLDSGPTERLVCGLCAIKLQDAHAFRKQVEDCEKAYVEKLYGIKVQSIPASNVKVSSVLPKPPPAKKPRVVIKNTNKPESKRKLMRILPKPSSQENVRTEFSTTNIQDKRKTTNKKKYIEPEANLLKGYDTSDEDTLSCEEDEVKIEVDDAIIDEDPIAVDHEDFSNDLEATNTLNDPMSPDTIEKTIKLEQEEINDLEETVDVEQMISDEEIKLESEEMDIEEIVLTEEDRIELEEKIMFEMAQKKGRVKTLKKNESSERLESERRTPNIIDNDRNNLHNARTIVKYSYACPFKSRSNCTMCFYCLRSFSSPTALRRHVLTHDVDKFEAAFKLNKAKFSFIKLDITRIDCRLCKVKICTLKGFIHHIVNIHNIRYYTHCKAGVIPFKLLPDEYKCVECDVGFASFEELAKDMNRHYNNYSCDGCGDKFKDEGTLLAHSAVHEGDRGNNISCDLFDSTTLPLNQDREGEIKSLSSPEFDTHLNNTPPVQDTISDESSNDDDKILDEACSYDIVPHASEKFLQKNCSSLELKSLCVNNIEQPLNVETSLICNDSILNDISNSPDVILAVDNGQLKRASLLTPKTNNVVSEGNAADKIHNEAQKDEPNDDTLIPKQQPKSKCRNRGKDYCLFCEGFVLNFARHLTRHHVYEPEVQKILSTRKKSHERKDLITALRKKGNFIQNSVEITKPMRKQKLTDYLPCTNCLGFYSKKLLWKHKKKCTPNSYKTTKYVQSEAQNLLIRHLKMDEKLRDTVFPRMRADKTSLVAKSDVLICAFGSQYLKTRRKKHLVNLISRKMRELAKLLQEIKNINPSIKDLFDALRPINYDTIVAATKIVGKYDSEKDRYASPTFAMNISTSIKQCCVIAILFALKKQEPYMEINSAEVVADLKTVIQMIDSNWKYDISSQAASDLNTNICNKVSIVQLANDLKILKEYLGKRSEEAANKIKEGSFNVSTYIQLLETVYCRVLLLNRLRPGELQRIKVHDYLDSGNNASDKYEEFDRALTVSEKILVQKFKRVVIRDRRGRCILILFNKDVQEDIKLLLSIRDTYVSSSNRFLFVTPGFENTIYDYKVLEKHARLSGTKIPKAISSRRLRKHLATLSQILSMSENDKEQLATFMGHTNDVHKKSYLIPDDVYQTAKISKLLILMEDGKADAFRGKSLDEIEIDLNVQLNEGMTENDSILDYDLESPTDAHDIIDGNTSVPAPPLLPLPQPEPSGPTKALEPVHQAKKDSKEESEDQKRQTKKKNTTRNLRRVELTDKMSVTSPAFTDTEVSLQSMDVEKQTEIIAKTDSIIYISDDSLSESETPILQNCLVKKSNNPISTNINGSTNIPDEKISLIDVSTNITEDSEISMNKESQPVDLREIVVPPSKTLDESSIKKNFCPFCNKLQSKIARHLELVHKSETEVKNFIKLPKGNLQRKKLIEKIRKKGNFIHNTQKEHNTGILITCRQQSLNQNSAEDYVCCKNCKGFFSKKTLRLHYSTCCRNDSKKGAKQLMVMGRILAGYIHPKANSALRRIVFPVLRDDQITRLIKYDELIINVGNKLCDKYTLDHQHDMIRHRLRLLGRFLMAAKAKNSSITDLASIFQPKFFDVVLKAIKKCASFDKVKMIYGAPSVATTTGTLLKKCIKLHISESIHSGNVSAKEAAEDFFILFNEAISTKKEMPENSTVAVKKSKNVDPNKLRPGSTIKNKQEICHQSYKLRNFRKS